MEEVDENISRSIESCTDQDVDSPKALDDIKHMNGQCVTGKTYNHGEIIIKGDIQTTSTQNGLCDVGVESEHVQKVQNEIDHECISSQKENGNENSDIFKNGSNSTETDSMENDIKPVIPMAKVIAKARNSLKDLAAKVFSSSDRRPDSSTSQTNENEKEGDRNKVINDTIAIEIDSKEQKPDKRNGNNESDTGFVTGAKLDNTDVDQEKCLEDALLNPKLEEGIHMEIASDNEDYLLQLSPDKEPKNCEINEEVPAEQQIKTDSDNDDKNISADHEKGMDVLNHSSSNAHSTESVQSFETGVVHDKTEEGCVLKNESDNCNLNSTKHETDEDSSKAAFKEVGDKKPMVEEQTKDTKEMTPNIVEIDITPEKSPHKKESRKDDEVDDDDVIFEGESKVELATKYNEPDHKDLQDKNDSMDQSKLETEKIEQNQTPIAKETPVNTHIIEDDDDVIFEKETKIDLSVQNICKEKSLIKSKESVCELKPGVSEINETSKTGVCEDESRSKPICDKKETADTSVPKSEDNTCNIERKRAAEESQLDISDCKRSKLEPACVSKETVSPDEEPASIDLIDSDEEMDTTEHITTSVPQNDASESLSEEKKDTKMITMSAEVLEALVRKKVKEYLAVQKDLLLAQMSQKIKDCQSNNNLWKRQVKDLQVKVNDVTVLQQKHEKRKAHTAALRQITTRNVAIQVDDGRTGATKAKPQVATSTPSSPLLSIPKALPPAPGRIVTSPPGGTGTIRLPIPQSSIAPPIMTTMITQQPVTTDFKTPTVKSLLGTTRTQPTISSMANTTPTSSAPIVSMQNQRVVTVSTAAATYISIPQGAVTNTSTKIMTNSNGTAKIIDLTDDEPRMSGMIPQVVASVGGTGVRTVPSQGSQIVRAGFPNSSGTIQLVLASGNQPLKPGTIITGLPQKLIQNLPQSPVSGVNLSSPPPSTQPLVVTTLITHPRPAAPPLLHTSAQVPGLVTGLPSAQVTGLVSIPVTNLKSAPVMALASVPVTSLATAAVTGQASAPVRGKALPQGMGVATTPATSLAVVPVTGLASAQATSQASASTSAPSQTTTIAQTTSSGQSKIMPNKHPAPFPLMNTLKKAELGCFPPKPSLRVSRVNQDLKEWEKSYTRITDEENFQEDVYLDYSVFMNGEEEMGQNIYVDHEMSSEPSGDISSNTENVPEENPDDYCTNMSYNRETLLEENHISDYCIILSNDDDENVDNDGNLSSKAFQETLYNGDHYNEITFRDEVTPKSNENCDDTDSNESQQYTGNDFEKQESDRQKHACLYCGEFYLRISTHYLRCHSGRPEVFQILKFPSGSKSRKLRFDTLKDKGDSKHAETSRSKSGVKIWKKRNNNSKTHTGKLEYHTASGNDEDKGADEDKQHQSKYKISCDSNVKGRRKTERHLAKGRRTPWSKKEERIVMRHLGHCVKFGRTPCKQECEAVKKSAPKILRDRTWVMIKLFIRNRILREMKGVV